MADAFTHPASPSEAPRAEWIFIALTGVFLMGGHPFTVGTIALGCLFIAAVVHQWTIRRSREPEPAIGLGPP